MNCQTFETILTDLSRNQVMDLSVRDSGLAHTKTCDDCAAKLRDQSSITAGLQQMALLSQSEKASNELEQKLTAAFAQRRVVASAPFERASRRQAIRWFAAAAVLILTIGGAATWRQISSSGEETLKAPSVAGNNSADDVERSPSSSTPVSAEDSENQAVTKKADSKPRTANNRRSKRRPTTQNVVEHPREIATSFIPVSGNALIPIDGGLVVRVELPRSALVSFGLPMNMERVDERIKADVVLGNDGLARAIRFIETQGEERARFR